MYGQKVSSAEILKAIMERNKIRDFRIVTLDIDEIIENIYKTKDSF